MNYSLCSGCLGNEVGDIFGSEVLTAVKMFMLVLRVVTPRELIGGYLHLAGIVLTSVLKMKAVCSSCGDRTDVLFSCFFLLTSLSDQDSDGRKILK